MKKIIVSLVLMIMMIGTASAGTGAIWTTKNDCGDSTQDANEYVVGEIVYINGKNFPADSPYNWDITGVSGPDKDITIASGNLATNSSGAFCFAAYTIQADDDGVYKAQAYDKTDNYHVTLTTVPPVKVPETALAVAAIALLTPGMIYLARKRK